MANVKAKMPMVATLSTSGSTDTYSGGIAIGKLMEVALSINFSEGSLYGDDGLAEYVKEFKEVDVTLNTTSLPDPARSMMFGETVSSTGTASVTSKTTDTCPYVGFGFIVGEMKDGVTTYKVVWLPKVKFALPNETYTTKGDSVSFGTPSISGKAVANGAGEWKKITTYDSETAAETALKTLVGVSE